ncbi:MAG: hypothetical protein A2018_00200 [Alphaproteobacteria bacterium GWF2_58_20]|nr:MAG: hypothetical protein A2018_00200 [Alphaproteobacteria bacterium GWF2_58_20]
MKLKTSALLALIPFLAACAPIGLVAGAGATVGIIAAQERSLGDAVDDTTIRFRINELWFKHNSTLNSSLGLSINEGRVLITGSVENPDLRVDAVRLTWQVPGVKEVINEIQVTRSEGVKGFARDSWISAQLKTSLMFDRDIAAINYSTDAVNGVVYIMGIAQSQNELDRVLDHARNLKYVRRVISYVRLKSEPLPGEGSSVPVEINAEASFASPAPVEQQDLR